MKKSERKKVPGNLAGIFTDFTIYDSVLQQELCWMCKMVNAEKNTENYSDEDVEEHQPLPTSEEAVVSFQLAWQYLTSFPVDDASIKQLTQLERKFLFICWICHNRKWALLLNGYKCRFSSLQTLLCDLYFLILFLFSITCEKNIIWVIKSRSKR